ncbi:unnamed protein product [Vitrella brassicaformis CCMP3155]|uniref:ADP-ribosylation factor n=1 Tax=Vitrella brassicaformis (strain CCMP3155) TaxID=1169540 RepID=A0A0G4EML2_VITBC|nr:unnamed protein product [Vitrella brassicaformis CCMP3155]|mmetsp:Transcript_42572/g.106287  ORF Transcript_42572/g.106287 Transcript_42572/m.106287 type:complete len:183 (-) Transcript_42572:886-1434(-)|eukprot:CEL98048.1 unnamed protein product [Vitrella brassicaformis CCMP3155]
MGLFVSELLSLVSSQKPCRAVMVGLDAAGKTTLLYKIRLGEVVTTVPTIGFNVETVEYRNLNFTVWDIGGQHKIRQLWRYYYPNIDLIIWVVDSSDAERLDESAEELHSTLREPELADAALLVYANKQDLPGALSAAQLADRLALNTITRRPWFIQAACARTGDGLFEGLDWGAEQMIRKRK